VEKRRRWALGRGDTTRPRRLTPRPTNNMAFVVIEGRYFNSPGVGGVVAGGRRTSRDCEVDKRIRKRCPPDAAVSPLTFRIRSELK